MDIDLETLEEILEELEKKKRERHKDFSRDSQSGQSDVSRSDSADSSPSQKQPKLSRETMAILKLDKPANSGQQDAEELRRQVEESRRREEEAQKEENTVFITSLPLKATEDDIFTFMKENKVGLVKDIRIIKDPRSRKSKGMAYVEFYEPESVKVAVGVKNKLMGQTIVISYSYADKNRAHLNTRLRSARPQYSYDPPTKQLSQSVLVKHLVGKLAEMREKDVENLFAPFGGIERVELDFDPVTRRNKGQAIVQFSKAESASLAIRKMNGFVVHGEPIIVTQVPTHLMMSTIRMFEEDDKSRKQALTKGPGETNSSLPTLINPLLASIETRMKAMTEFRSKTTKVLGLFNLMADNIDHDGAKELKREVKRECEKYGKVEDIRVDRKTHKAVFIRFAHKSDAQKAFEGFFSRQFDGKPVVCGFFDYDIIDS